MYSKKVYSKFDFFFEFSLIFDMLGKTTKYIEKLPL